MNNFMPLAYTTKKKIASLDTMAIICGVKNIGMSILTRMSPSMSDPLEMARKNSSRWNPTISGVIL